MNPHCRLLNHVSGYLAHPSLQPGRRFDKGQEFYDRLQLLLQNDNPSRAEIVAALRQTLSLLQHPETQKLQTVVHPRNFLPFLIEAIAELESVGVTAEAANV